MKFSFKQAWPYLILVLLMALGAALRLTPLLNRDFWYDEAFTGILIHQSWGDMFQSIVHDVHPPLYYWLLKIWSLGFGSSVLALRAFSVTCGVALIGTVFATLKAWHKDTVWPALIGALVITVSPFFVNYSQEARMYALFGLLITLSAALYVRAWRLATPKSRFVFGASLALLCLTHYLGVIFSLAWFVFDVIQHRLWQNYRQPKQLITFLGSAYAFPALLGLAWLPFFLTQILAHASLGWVPTAPLHRLATSVHIFLFGAPVGVAGVPPALGYSVAGLEVADVTLILIIAITLLIGWLTFTKRWTPILRFLGFMTAVPLLMVWLMQFAGERLYVERFLTGAAIFLVLFLASAVGHLRERLMFPVIVAYIVLVSLVKPWSYDMPMTALHDYLNRYPTDLQFIFTNAYDYTLGRYYTGEARPILLYPEDSPYQVLHGWVVIPIEGQVSMVPATHHLLITHNPDRYPGYTTVNTVADFTILESL